MLHRYRKTIRQGLAGTAAALCLAAAASAATPADTLVIAKQIDDLISLDPAESYEISGGEIDANVYDRLLTYDLDNLAKLTGGVAESWTVSPDGKTFTFKIRPGLKFQTGRALTARDAAYSLQRVVILNKTPAFILTQFGWTAANAKTAITAPDDATLVLTFDTAYAPSFILNCLSANVTSVVDSVEAEKHAKDNDYGHDWLTTTSAGSGAYHVVSWKAKDAVVLESNGPYWRGTPALKRIVIRHIAEPTTQRLLLEKGDADIARNLGSDQIAALAANPDIKVETAPRATIIYLGLSQKVPELTKPQVQQAIRWAIDYQGMADTIVKGQYVVHQAFWSSGFAGALDDTPFHLDIAKAKALLAEAGLPDGFELQLDVANISPYIDIAQSLQATFGQAGIKLTLIQADQKQVFTRYRARSHQSVLVYWSPDYPDANSTADFFARNTDNSDATKIKSGAWRNSWDVPELSRATEAALLEPDADKRAQAYLDLQRRLQASGPLPVLFQLTEQAVLRRNVTGFLRGPSAAFFWKITK